MKKIELHKIDEPEVINWNFNRRQKHLPNYIIDAKETFRFLFYVFKDSSELLQMSVAEKPELSLQKHWFTYGLNCISEFCRLAHFPNIEKEAQIDDSGSFKIKVEELKLSSVIRTEKRIIKKTELIIKITTVKGFNLNLT